MRRPLLALVLAAACSSAPDGPPAEEVTEPAPPEATEPATSPSAPAAPETPPPAAPMPPATAQPPQPAAPAPAPATPAAPRPARPSSTDLEAKWTPVFEGLRQRYASTRQTRQAASDELDSKLTLSAMPTTDGVAAKQRVDDLRAQLQQLDAELRSIEQEFATKQEEARREGAPAIVYRDGLG